MPPTPQFNGEAFEHEFMRWVGHMNGLSIGGSVVNPASTKVEDICRRIMDVYEAYQDIDRIEERRTAWLALQEAATQLSDGIEIILERS